MPLYDGIRYLSIALCNAVRFLFLITLSYQVLVIPSTIHVQHVPKCLLFFIFPCVPLPTVTKPLHFQSSNDFLRNQGNEAEVYLYSRFKQLKAEL